MNIGIIEQNVASLGGRQRTMLCFADYFKSQNHVVRVYSQFDEKRGAEYNEQTFLRNCHFKHLTHSDITWIDIKHSVQRHQMPREWKKLDILLVPYGGYGYLQEYLPSVRVICWVIHPDQRYCESTTEIWTNSKTTKKRLLNSPNWQGLKSIIHVIIPPHDYSLFRSAAKPWNRRETDLITIGNYFYDKGVIDFDRFAAKHKYHSVIISGTWCHKRQEQLDVKRQLTHSIIREDMESSRVATLLGDSKVYLSMSRAESCSLALYEAMNAGCNCVVPDVGAAREQLGDKGLVYSGDPSNYVKQALTDPHHGLRWRGKMFDRADVGQRINKRLTDG